MTITIDLSPEQERRLAERAARAGQDVTGYVHHLIDRDIDAESLDAILAPVRRDFEQSGMTDDDLAALVEEVGKISGGRSTAGRVRRRDAGGCLRLHGIRPGPGQRERAVLRFHKTPAETPPA